MPKTTSELLRAWKDAERITDTVAAQRIGVSQSAFSDWLAGRSVPSLDKAALIAHSLRLPEDEVTLSIAYSRKRRATSVDEIMQVVTEALSQLGDLERRVAALEESAPPGGH